jgi:hypothetical protein
MHLQLLLTHLNNYYQQAQQQQQQQQAPGLALRRGGL